MMTYPLIGNYGINAEDFERFKPYARGFIMGEMCAEPSNWRSTGSVAEFLIKHDMVAISGIDTRALTRRLREHGTMKGAVACGPVDVEALLARVEAAPDLSSQDLVGEVTTKEPYVFYDSPGAHVVIIDFGSKQNIMRCLRALGCKVSVAPAYSNFNEIMNMHPDGIILSNGPGDPKTALPAIETARLLMQKLPVFGICLGHQIMGLAMGADTYKLRYGHRGANHPVQDVVSKQVYITSQNHGFAVDSNTLPADVVVSHINLNDGTVEGLRHLYLPVASVQYHPKASPGPQESRYLFDQFLKQIEAV